MYSNLVSIPPDIDISDIHELSILFDDVILDEKCNIATHP